jgi:hypothetical protein
MSEEQAPYGKPYPDDEGPVSIVITQDKDKKLVRIDFPRPIRWLALDPETADRVGTLMIMYAAYLSAIAKH